jgi:hypothetical protein
MFDPGDREVVHSLLNIGQSFNNPESECDMVMSGRITSGLISPLSVRQPARPAKTTRVDSEWNCHADIR